MNPVSFDGKPEVRSKQYEENAPPAVPMQASQQVLAQSIDNKQYRKSHPGSGTNFAEVKANEEFGRLPGPTGPGGMEDVYI